MIAIYIERQLAGCFQKLLPTPGFVGVITGRGHPLGFEDIGVIVNMGRHPTGANAIPAPFTRTTLRFLGLNEVILRPNEGIALELVCNIKQ
jgi:hypothetical protein